jgi:hypothetical protein
MVPPRTHPKLIVHEQLEKLFECASELIADEGADEFVRGSQHVFWIA